LSSIVDAPLYMSTLTVGRKMTNVICRRAVCCRAWGYGDVATPMAKEPKRTKIEESREENVSKCFTTRNGYKLNHPVIMGTSVYIDEEGVLDMSGDRTTGQDFRFESNLCWVMAGNWETAECIDGKTGFACVFDPTCEDLMPIGHGSKRGVSKISTAALTEQFASVAELSGSKLELNIPTFSLAALRGVKLTVSPEHENAKEDLISKHRVFRQWARRTAT
jgi:hypothetical protein